MILRSFLHIPQGGCFSVVFLTACTSLGSPERVSGHTHEKRTESKDVAHLVVKARGVLQPESES